MLAVEYSIREANTPGGTWELLAHLKTKFGNSKLFQCLAPKRAKKNRRTHRKMWRSARMACCDVFLQPEAAFESMSSLGEMGCVQFIDMNPEVPPYSRHYVSELCRFTDMERKLRFIHSELIKDKIYLPYPADDPKPIYLSELVAYENLIENWELDITEISQNQISLMRDLLELKEMRYVFNTIGPYLGDSENMNIETIMPRRQKKSGGGDMGNVGRLIVMTGVVRRARCFPFELMLWRISRGNIYYRQAAEDEVLTDPYTGAKIRKVAFLAVCQGEMLGTRMGKVLSGFRVNIYPCPVTKTERFEMLDKIQMRIYNLEEVMNKSRYFRCKALRSVGRMWRTWMSQVLKSKAICHNMNLFTLDITKNCFIGRCWVPENDLKRVQDKLKLYAELKDSKVASFMSKIKTNEEPPTFHPVNKFTLGFQVVIDAYGHSQYGEINPALFSIITFPFLFAVMFGDMGHGILLAVMAGWMINEEDRFSKLQDTSEIWNICFGGRYVILLLGMFSMFTGFVYNDFFSHGFNLSKSMWKNTKTELELLSQPFFQLEAVNRQNRPYMFGLDPIWPLAKNKIINTNSMKMKLSIIIGIIHMLFGLVLSLFNKIHFKHYYAIWFEFIPEFLFLFCLFFWLVFMIYYKWFIYFERHPNPKLNAVCAPHILILFIDMILLSTSKIVPGEGCDIYFFDNQQTIQFGLIAVALSCVPVLLLGSPIYINYKNKKKRKQIMAKWSVGGKFRSYQNWTEYEEKMNEFAETELAGYNTPLSELMINQGVHTIEFVLSTVSHTASYLRLWALSLAHSELSEMLWMMIMSNLALRDFSIMGVPKIFVIFAAWAFFTVAILVLMEGLSAFLHTLRLHWVEFMSKFFLGGGYPFTPFCFKSILTANHDNAEGICTSYKRRKQDEEIELKQLEDENA